MKRVFAGIMRLGLLSIGLLLLPGILPLANTVVPDSSTQGGEVIITYGGGEPRHLNPALISGSSTAMVGTQIFASPLRYDEEWNPLPYLAESWEVSDDGLAVTLHLVKNATFHDGQPITSSDVAFSVGVVRENHPFGSMFAPVDRVDTPDDYTAILRLTHPHPAILLAMSPALLPIIPEHVYGDGQDLATHPANLAPVGSGPFMLGEWVSGESIRLDRYEGFFIEGRPYLDRIIIRYENDPAAQVIALERQEAHMTAMFEDLDALDRLSRSEHLIVTDKGTEGLGPINWLAFNLLRPPLSDVQVRQAIAYAIDCEFIVDYLHRGRSRRADSPISPASPLYDSAVPDYPVDLVKAARLLDDAGYPVLEDGVRFSMTLDFIPLLPTQQHDVAYTLQRQLGKVGIDVMVRESANFAEWAQRIASWDFDMTMDIVYNWGDPAIGVHRTYESSNIRQGVLWSNTQNYRSATVDDLLNRALIETDPQERRLLYSQFQMQVAEDLPILWINLLPYHTVYHQGLGNPPLTIWGIHSPMDEMYWRSPPEVAYVTPPSVAQEEVGSLKDIGTQAILLIQAVGVFEAKQELSDETSAFLDLVGTGRHILGVTRGGTVYLDTADQLRAGMEIDRLYDLDGANILDQLIRAADGDGYAGMDNAWAHPTTGRLGQMRVWCGWLTRDDLVCVLEWDPNE